MLYIVSCKFRTSVVTSNKYSPAGSWYHREKNQRMFQAASFFNANNPGFEILFFGSFFLKRKRGGWCPANIYLFKANNRNTWKRCEVCWKLPTETPERRSRVCIVNFEHISHLFFLFFYFWLRTSKC